MTKLFYPIFGFAILILIFQILQLAKFEQVFSLIPFYKTDVSTETLKIKTESGEVAFNLEQLTKELLPDKKVLAVTWKGIPYQLLERKIIDLEKLKVYSQNYGQIVTDEDLKIFGKNYDGNIVITPNNSVLIYNVLWAIGFASKSPILDYELEKYGFDTVKNLAGYYFSFANLGNGSTLPQSGYNSFDLIQLSGDQKDLVMELVGKSAVPSCGNPLHLPDCSCSFAIDALVLMMAQQEFSKQQIYQIMKDIYPYRFPGIYIQQAIFFKLAKNQDWKDVNAEELISVQFSSAQGVAQMRKGLVNILQPENIANPANTGKSENNRY